MIKKLEEFVFGKVAGRVAVRAAGSIAAWAVGRAAANGVHLDPAEVSGALITGFNLAWTYLKDWRDARAAKAAEAPKP